MRRVGVAAAFVGMAALQGCGDDRAKVVEANARAVVQAAFGEGGIRVGPPSRGDGRYAGTHADWDGPGLPGEAGAVEVVPSGDGDRILVVTLERVAFARGGVASRIALKPVQGAGGVEYEVSDLEGTLWGLGIRADRVLVQDAGGSARVEFERGEITGGNHCLPSALARRWAGNGALVGRFEVRRGGGGFQVTGRLGPPGDEADVEAFGRGTSAGSFLSIPWAEPERLRLERGTVSFLGADGMGQGARATSVEEACAAIAGSGKVAVAMRVVPGDPGPAPGPDSILVSLMPDPRGTLTSSPP